MATGTKKKRALGKKGKYKKPAKQKGKKRKGKAAAAIVGVVSSISVTTPLQNAIKKGGNFSNLSIIPALGYDQATIQAAISQFNNNVNIQVIITVGGGVTYAAAAAMGAALVKPFVSVVGEEPAPGNQADQCYGGVTLRSCQTDSDRINKTLYGKGFQPTQIGLYYNPKSAMAENISWPGGTNPGQVIPATVPNNAANYPGDLAKFAAGIKAIVISADPFFQDTSAALIAAVNNTNLYCCYSLQDFNGKHGKASLHGPKLQEAYTLVGNSAANALANGFPAGFTSSRNYVNDA